MHVVVGGAGEVGRNITGELRREGHDVVLMDVDPAVCDEVAHLDCMVVEGHAASAQDLRKAGIEEADVFYAVTSLDEVNLAAAAVAKSLGAGNVFARVNSLDLMDEAESREFQEIGVDAAVSPDLVAAERIRRLVHVPGVLDVDAFEIGNLPVIETRIGPESEAVGRRLRDLGLPPGMNLVALFRGAEIVIPRGDDRLTTGDRAVLVLKDADLLAEVRNVFGERADLQTRRRKAEHVVVSGSTGIARRIARRLRDDGIRVTMVAQPDEPGAIQQLAADMEDILVLEGSSRDVSLYHEENLDEADAVVAASPHEEFNIITCLLAASLGVDRTMALVDQPELEELAERIGVSVAVSPRLTAVSTLLKYASEIHPEEMALLHGGDAQVLLVDVEAGDPIAGKPLRDIQLPRGSVIGAILRDGEGIVPGGAERIQAGDSVVFFTLSETAPELSELV